MLQLPSLERAFPPSLSAILDVCRVRVSDAELKLISHADYGCGADVALPLLRTIHQTGVVDSLDQFELSEVLELTRWSNPDCPNEPPFVPGPVGESGHRTRMFACSVLLVSDLSTELGYADRAFEETLVQALKSAKVLGEMFNHALGQYLTLRLKHSRSFCNEEWFALFVVIVRNRLFEQNELLDVAATAFLDVESAEAARRRIPPEDVEAEPVRPNKHFWHSVESEFRHFVAAMPSCDLRERLELCLLALC